MRCADCAMRHAGTVPTPFWISTDRSQTCPGGTEQLPEAYSMTSCLPSGTVKNRFNPSLSAVIVPLKDFRNASTADASAETGSQK